ncbi:MAG: hypothetical protein ABEJ23_07955 [Haloarculaceae archaeon]
MTLRCSLLGHRFEEVTVEREREERGDEVVTVSREIETCSRCDARRVVSENTEVTTVEPSPDAGDAGDADGGFGGLVERSDADGSTGTGDADLDPPDDPAEEDAEILTDEPSPERQPGEWPDEPASTPDESVDASEPTDDASAPDAGLDLAAETETETGTGTLACPACGFTTDAAGSSLRSGDACPECMDGYLETR